VTSTEWKKQKERGAPLGFKMTLFIYKVLGKTICSIIIYPIVFYFCLTGKKGRTNAINFQQRVITFGKKDLPKPGFSSALKHYLNFSFSVLDKFAVWLKRITYKDITWDDRHLFTEHLKKGEGAFLLSAHYGNIEIMRAVSQLISQVKVNVIMDNRNAETFNRLLKEVNDQSNLHIFPLEKIGPNTAIILKEKLAQGEIVACMADRVTDQSQERVETLPFLGENARFPQGPFILAALLKAPTYSFFCVKENKKYRVILNRLCDLTDFNDSKRGVLVKRLVEKYVKDLETRCLKDPYQWYNFYNFWQENKPDGK
jgi:predicted LPLAT superfamily acyltransferase